MELYTIGVDVGGTKTAYGLFDSSGNILAKFKHPSDQEAGPEVFFDRIAGNVEDLLEKNGVSLDNLRGIGIGMPSFILYEEGYIIKTANLTNLRDFAARDYLRKRFGGNIRVLLDNDTHVAALAEYRKGAGRGFDNIIYCAVSTGIASGIIINGNIFRGRYGWAGESGHTIVSPGDGIRCGCGNEGCMMSWCSGSMIIKHIQKWIAEGEETLMTELAGSPEKITALHLDAAWEKGDPLARRALEQMARYLAVWLFNLYVTLNINCFVFGGGLLLFGDKLFGRVREIFDAYNRDDHPVYFLNAENSEDFGIIGAAELFF